MNNTTLAKVYGAIIGIPVGAILLASAVGGGSNSPQYGAYEGDLDRTTSDAGPGFAGSGKSEADAYDALGKYNPCLFLACEGE